MIVYPFIHPSAIKGGTFYPELQQAWEEQDRRRIISLNRQASERQARIRQREGDGSDGRDVAAEVTLRFDRRGTVTGRFKR